MGLIVSVHMTSSLIGWHDTRSCSCEMRTIPQIRCTTADPPPPTPPPPPPPVVLLLPPTPVVLLVPLELDLLPSLSLG